MKSAHGHELRPQSRHYLGLAWMALLSIIAMYVLMYAMVDRFENVHANLNQFYMAGLMAMPMIVIELLLMRSMYTSRRLNGAIVAGCVFAGLAFWFGIRQQFAIDEKQFLRSMIPHHGSALLMCRRTEAKDSAVLDLCRRIVAGQTAEIAEMERLLRD